MKANHSDVRSKVATLLLACRPKFFAASIAPVVVGSSLGYATVGSFNTGLFVLALLAIMALHAGANLANDYYDHLSKNDWLNRNPTPFSGGSRFIQNGIVSPKVVLLSSLMALVLGSIIGVLIVAITQSLFVLALGAVGLLGGFFYTARPFQLGYRCVGEVVIFLLFGLLPVYASYYLQTETIDANPLLPGCMVGLLIFLVILANEFPDVAADAEVDKKTLVVRFGVPASVWLYRIGLTVSFAIAALMLIRRPSFLSGALYMLNLPIAVLAVRRLNEQDMVKPGQFRACSVTVLLHNAGCLALSMGFLISPVL